MTILTGINGIKILRRDRQRHDNICGASCRPGSRRQSARVMWSLNTGRLARKTTLQIMCNTYVDSPLLYCGRTEFDNTQNGF